MDISQVSPSTILLVDDDSKNHYLGLGVVECEDLGNNRFRIYHQGNRIIEGTLSNVRFNTALFGGTDRELFDTIVLFFSPNAVNTTTTDVGALIGTLSTLVSTLIANEKIRNIRFNFLVPNGANYGYSVSYFDSELYI